MYYGEYNLLQVLRTIDFHSILSSFVMSFSISFMYSINPEVFLKSFDHMDLKSAMIVIRPMVGALGKFGSGLLSDLTLTTFPRIWYLIGALILQILTILLSCFIGDQTAITIMSIIVQFGALAFFVAVTPIIISDNYGTKYFASIMGTVFLFGAVECLVMSRLVLVPCMTMKLKVKVTHLMD